MQKIISFFKQEAVLCIACILAVISAFVVPPDAQYLEYIDFRTLGLLFCLMAVMAGLQEIGVFRRLAQGMLAKVGSMRQLVPILVMLCFFSSMLMTNDVALITFVPFTFTVLGLAGEDMAQKHRIPIVVMQTIAANLGSMFTPIGNPQNLYLYGVSQMPLGQFLLLMLPYTAVSGILLLLWGIWYTRRERTTLTVAFEDTAESLNWRRLAVYLVLFVLSLLTVARLVDWRITLGIVLLAVLLADRSVLFRVDYSLLLTFVGFFVFIGNMGRIPVFRDFLESMIAGHEVVTAVAASQVISNVPAALLLSGFTKEYAALIVGTNLGGLGTLIASMASLISFKCIGKEASGIRGRYLLYFTAASLAFLAVLMGMYWMMG
ncbi:MAG: citrate transporter [Ruminococcus sp.]|nr:citrate transporter [Ruminococcus sp.]